MGSRRRLGGLVLGMCLLGGGVAAAAEPRLRILASHEVPASPSSPTDVRWAGADSVYLAREFDGVFEVALEPQLPVRSHPVLDRNTFRFPGFARIAASRDHLAVANFANALAWRPLQKDPDGSVRFDRWPEAGALEAIDLLGDRLLFLGAPRYPANDPRARDAGVAWTGTLSRHLADLKPLLADAAGSGAPSLYNCLFQGLGAVRFFPDGSMFVVPGFQPGAFLFGPSGEVLRTWNTALLGLDADTQCAGRTESRRQFLYGHPEERYKEVNRHRTVDAVLPLPEGPGLLVRFMVGGRPHWELEVLRPQSVVSYAVPLVGDRPDDRLRGDVRDGKIVLLLAGQSVTEPLTGRLLVMAFPKE